MGIKPVVSGAVTVATAGTRVQVTASNIYVTSVYFEALSGNVGAIFVGDSTVSSVKYMTRLGAGGGFNLSAQPGSVGSSSGGGEINLSTLYVDSATNGDKIMVTYMQRVGSS